MKLVALEGIQGADVINWNNGFSKAERGGIGSLIDLFELRSYSKPF